MKRLALVVLLNSALGGAMPFSCFTNFTGLTAHDPQAVKLVDDAFLALLDLPKDSDVKRRLARALLEGKDPFDLPAGDGELAGVRKKLDEFHDMVERLGWDGPVTRARLLALTEQRLAELSGAEQKKFEVIKNTAAATRVAFPGALGLEQSPDGRYLISQAWPVVNPGYAHPRGFEVLDTFTGKTKQHLEPGGAFEPWKPGVTSDGARLFFSLKNQIAVTSFQNGVPGSEFTILDGRNFYQRVYAKLIANAEPPEIARTVAAKNPSWVIAQFKKQPGLHLVDLDRKTFAPLKGTKDLNFLSKTGQATSSWGLVPGTNQIIVVKNVKSDTVVVQTAELGADGKLGAWQTIAELPCASHFDLNSKVTVQASLSVLANVPRGGAVTVVPLNGGKPYELAHLPERAQKNMSDAVFLLHPNGREMLVTFRYKPPTEEIPVYSFNLETGAYTGSVTVPRTEAFDLTRDGESLIAKERDHVTLVRWRERVEAP